MPNQEDIVELSFENGVRYKIYVPFKENGIIGMLKKIYLNSKKPYEYELLSHTLTQLPKNATIIDIGANIGNHSLFWAANGFRILAFEANTKFSEIFKESIKLNGFEDKIKLYEFGLSDKEERLYFRNEFDITLRAIDENSEENINFIECKSIDSLDIQDEIALVKIDIEGMEAKVIKGMKKLIEKNRPIIYAEGNYVNEFLETDRVLNELNYVHWDIFISGIMNMYYPMEKLNLNQMLQRNLSKMGMLEVLFNCKNQSSYSFLHRQIKQVSNNKSENIEHLKKTLTYRWGKSLLEASKSVCKFIILPLTLYKDYKEFKQYLNKRNKK